MNRSDRGRTWDKQTTGSVGRRSSGRGWWRGTRQAGKASGGFVPSTGSGRAACAIGGDAWSRERRTEDGQAATGVRLVAVKVIEDTPALADSGLVVVAPRGVRVQIARGFDAATLSRVLATLEAAA